MTTAHRGSSGGRTAFGDGSATQQAEILEYQAIKFERPLPLLLPLLEFFLGCQGASPYMFSTYVTVALFISFICLERPNVLNRAARSVTLKPFRFGPRPPTQQSISRGLSSCFLLLTPFPLLLRPTPEMSCHRQQYGLILRLWQLLSNNSMPRLFW